MITVERLNVWGTLWTEFVWGSLLDATVVLVLVSLLWGVLWRRMPAQLGYCLFLLVPIKLMVPLSLSVPGWPDSLSPRHAVAVAFGWTADSQGTPSTADALRSARSRFSGAPLSQTLPQSSPDEASSAVAPPPALSLGAMLMLSYGLIVLALLVGLAWVQHRCRRTLRLATPLAPDSLASLPWSELRGSLGIGDRVRLCTSPHVASPAIAGLLRPSLVLPTGFAETLTVSQMRFVLAHELAHVRRGDLWVASAQRIVQIVYFFNPAVWLANGIVDRLREYACDDEALLLCGSSRRDCGEGFLRVAERAGAPSMSMASALGLINRNRFIRRRLMRMIDPHRRVQTGLSAGAALCLAVAALITLPTVRASTENEEKSSSVNEPSKSATTENPQARRSEQREADRDEADDFDRLYRLGPDEVLKVITPPFPEGRLAYYRSVRSDDPDLNLPAVFFFRWRDHQRVLWGESGSVSGSGPRVESLIDLLTGIPRQEIVVDETLSEVAIKGDFIVREPASVKSILDRLQQILREQYELPVKLTFRDVKRSVLVTRGEYKFTPIPGRRGDRIEIYGDELQDLSKNYGMGGGRGTFDEFLQKVGYWLDVPVVSEVKNPPQDRMHWSYSMPVPATEEQIKKARDPKLVLANLTVQTGLTFTEEVREIPLLFVEPQDKDEDGAKQER